MVYLSDTSCPICGCKLKHRDYVKRMVRTKRGKRYRIRLQRLYCIGCGRIHRELPNNLLPYMQYERDIILGFLNGVLTNSNLDYEDYPCEITIKRWRSREIHDLYRK